MTDPDPQGDGRTALVLQAAHTVLPEAGVEQLPALARLEVQSGLTGEVRERFAQVDDPDDPWGRKWLTDGSDLDRAPALERWRDDLIERLVGERGYGGALALADQVHLGRIARGDVPPVVGAECVAWYGAYREGPHPDATVVAHLVDLFHTWLAEPDQRGSLDHAMVSEARVAVGERRNEILDRAV